MYDVIIPFSRSYVCPVLSHLCRMGCRFMPAYYHELVGQAEDQQDEWGRDYDEASSGEEGEDSGVGAGFSGALDPAEVELFALKSSWDVVKACDRWASCLMLFRVLYFDQVFFVFVCETGWLGVGNIRYIL